MSILSDEKIKELYAAASGKKPEEVCSIAVSLFRAIEAATLEELTKQEPVAFGILASNTGKVATVLLNASEADEYHQEHIVKLYAAPVVQPGMVMVPREATKAMCDAADDEYPRVLEHDIDPYRVWRIMITAAEKEAGK